MQRYSYGLSSVVLERTLHEEHNRITPEVLRLGTPSVQFRTTLPTSQVRMPEPEGVADHRHRTETHRSSSQHWTEEQSE